MEVAECHVRDAMQHTKIVLYCDPSLEEFYTKLGYAKWDVAPRDNIVMGKVLGNDAEPISVEPLADDVLEGRPCIPPCLP
jgi:hypothetical protein